MKLSEFVKELNEVHSIRTLRPKTMKTGLGFDPELDAAECVKLISSAKYQPET